MKGFKITINIFLSIELIVFVTLAILWPTVFMNDAIKSLQEGNEEASSVGEAVAKGFALGLVAAIMVLFFYAATALFIIEAIITLIILIVYNVKKYPSMGLCIISLLSLKLISGILMIIQRSKYLKQPAGI